MSMYIFTFHTSKSSNGKVAELYLKFSLNYIYSMKILQNYIQTRKHNYLPSFEANTWMETNVVQESWVYKG